ncbi:MAG: hypothetical protein ACOC9X_00885 [bacterium]
MDDKGPHYYAYLLRFWRDNGQASWRASLEDPHTGESFRFSSAQRLYDFLNELMHKASDDDPTHIESQKS